jgi:putative nucleotidyltransferase with HDIG domain
VIVWLAVVLWLFIVAWSLALMRAAGSNDPEPAPGKPPEPAFGVVPGAARERRPRGVSPSLREGRRRVTVLAQGVLLAAAVAGAVLVSDPDQWSPPAMVGLLAVLVIGSDLIVLDAKRFRIGVSFLGMVLAMATLGPAPAVALALAATAVDGLRSRPRPRGTYLLNNLVTHATFPLLGGLALHALHDPAGLGRGEYALAVFAVFMGANVLNFTMIAGHTVWLRGGSLRELFRTVYVPVLPWELATASITAMAVYGFELYGAGVVGIFAVALAVCQLLLRSLLTGHANGEEVERRRDQLDVRHEGMLALLLETLTLRDPTAARHAAAVARYAHELARIAGLSERECAIVHTAGLLHDIGKQALPDHLLLGRAEIQGEERRLIERHPTDGARVLLRVEGLGEVATAVLAHHERMDGHGYPDGLAGDDIPVVARILAVAEVYDALTAPDSYRIPVSAAEAEEELRRVAGTQLDGRLVFLFLTQVLRHGERAADGPAADLEAELLAQRHMRGALDQPLVLEPNP